MERQYNNGDFEKLLRDNANQYRMYPSEKVWKGIHSALHTRRRWYGITAAIMFLITGSLVSIIIYNGDDSINNVRANVTNPVTNQLAPAASEKYTPAIKSNKSKPNKPANVTELILNNQAFNFTNTEVEKQQQANSDEVNEVSAEETVILLIPVIEEESIADPLSTDPNLVRFNSELDLKKSETRLTFPENTIIEEDGLSNSTEDQIEEAISALASQDMPMIRSAKRARVTAQVYFTPTISYRKLTENKRVYNTGAFYVPVIDLNNVVKHKPAMGLEFGIEGRYHVNDKLSVKTGFQFNINRYDIRAYSHPTEIATVALNSGSGFDSMATTTNLRNYSSGTNPNWLENFYFQAGIPVGVELILSENNNVKWGVSGTIQPTYVIGDRAYLISSDYKNYARFPDLIRKWNISTGVGTFVSYSTGKIRWQVGPHVRYQHLSSFVSALTVKEKLFAIGLKVGATLEK